MILGIRPPPPESFDEWLKVATFDLVAPAKKRIKREIEAHFAESVAEHTARQGLSESAALEAALAELGNPGMAQGKFQKQYRTESEVKGLEGTVEIFRRRRLLLAYYFGFLIFSCTLLRHHKNGAISSVLVMFFVAIVFPTMAFIVARGRKAISHVHWVQPYSNLSPVLLFAWLGYRVFDPFSIILSALMLCLSCYRFLRSARRLRRAELPPQNAALS